MRGSRTPTRETAGAALLAVCVLLAGCNLVGTSGTETPTLTPLPVPTDDSRTGTADVLPPGVTTAGATEPLELAASHRRSLLRTSFTVVSNTTVTTANRTLSRSVLRARVASGGDRYHYDLTSFAAESYLTSAPARRIEFWYDGSRLLGRYDLGEDGVRFGYDPDPRVGGPFRDPVDSSRIITLFTHASGRPVARTTRNGTTLYRISGRAEEAPFNLPHSPSSREFAYTAFVDRNGVVHSYRLSYNATYENQSVHVTREVRFVGIGETTVPRPEWYEQALAERPSDAVSTREPSVGNGTDARSLHPISTLRRTGARDADA